MKKSKKFNNIYIILLLLFIFIIIIYSIFNKFTKKKGRKIINTHWYGRFGNRMFTYAFGCCYAKKYGCTYYYLSEWEGDKLFKKNKYAKPLIELDKKLYKDLINIDGKKEEVIEAIKTYNKRTKDDIEFIDMNRDNLGKTNIAYNDFNIMYDMFDVYDKNFLKNEVFVFNRNVKNTEIYKNLQKVKNTYFAAHIRMGDICDIGYKGAHSCIGDKIIEKIPEINKDKLPEIIVSQNKDIRKNNIKGFNLEIYNNKSKGHSWKQPEGAEYIDEIILEFLPDFLTLINAKVLLRSNSSLSYWAALLNDNQDNIYSPIANVNKENKYNKQNKVDIVKGNHPHFMGSQFKDININ